MVLLGDLEKLETQGGELVDLKRGGVFAGECAQYDEEGGGVIVLVCY